MVQYNVSLDRITTIFFDSKAARAKVIIRSIAVENEFIAFTMAQVPLADQAALITNEGDNGLSFS